MLKQSQTSLTPIPGLTNERIRVSLQTKTSEFLRSPVNKDKLENLAYKIDLLKKDRLALKENSGQLFKKTIQACYQLYHFALTNGQQEKASTLLSKRHKIKRTKRTDLPLIIVKAYMTDNAKKASRYANSMRELYHLGIAPDEMLEYVDKVADRFRGLAEAFAKRSQPKPAKARKKLKRFQVSEKLEQEIKKYQSQGAMELKIRAKLNPISGTLFLKGLASDPKPWDDD
jgi:hypothetical protein